jgi:hypothetical protein
VPAPGEHSADLVRSRQRVSDHGEVFTPSWLVESMLDTVDAETHRIDSRFLEPACGSGNFLVPILERKLVAVQARYGSSDFERSHHALFALMCVYGIELLADNTEECRGNLLTTFAGFLGVDSDDVWSRAAAHVLALNIVQGNAMTMADDGDEPITFPEWGYLGKGKYQRRDFRYDALTQRSSFHEVLVPVATHPAMDVHELATR